MRLLIACLVAVLAAGSVRAEELPAQGVPLTLELVDAYREYALARQQLIRYRQVILPLKQQAAADAIAQSRLEIAVLNRRLRDYDQVLRVGEFSPVETAAENDLLSRNDAAYRLNRLQDEQIALMRFSGETDKLYQYDVLRSALRVRLAQAALAD